MASKQHGHRAIAVGISGGIGLAVPLLAHVATQSSPEAQATVGMLSIPFAVGSFAGVGTYLLSTSLFDMLDRRAAQRASEYAGATASTASESVDASDSAAGAGESGASEAGRPAATEFDADVERFFGRHGKPDDVPVIARAAGAMSEAQAWEEIDSMLTDGSPISCDPSQSKDIYQIALEELARTGATGVVGRVPAEPRTADAGATSTASASVSASDAVTSDAAASDAAAPDAGVTTAFMAVAASREAVTSALTQDRLDERASREAAMDSLDVMVSEMDMPSVSPAPHPVDSVRIASSAPSAQATSLIDLDLDEPSGFLPQSASVPVSQGAAGSEAPATGPQPIEVISPAPASVVPAASATAAASMAVQAEDERGSFEVPVVDYSGHEEMWAAALAILAEPDEPAAPVGSHFATRVAAVNEGRRSTEMHSRVNRILDQELDRVESQSMRHTSREFLRVIQGGTAAMPRLQVEEA